MHLYVKLLSIKKRGINKSQRLAIITYHSISDNKNRYSTPIHIFEKQIAFINERFDVIRLSKIQDVLKESNNKKARVVITFDDGYKDFYENAYPILKELSVPCTLFVPTAFIGKTNEWDRKYSEIPRIYLLDKDELISLQKDGLVDIGSHSKSHVSMRKLPIMEMRKEASESKKELEDLLGLPITMFAYPYGMLQDMSQITSQILSQVGYQIAVTSHWGTWNSLNKILELKRISFKGNESLDNLRAKLEGWYDWIGLKESLGSRLYELRMLVR